MIFYFNLNSIIQLSSILIITTTIISQSNASNPRLSMGDGTFYHLNENLDQGTSIPNKKDISNENSSIFVSLVSFRDGSRCGRTLYSLFSNAANPERLRVGIVQQNQVLNSTDIDCLQWYCSLMYHFNGALIDWDVNVTMMNSQSTSDQSQFVCPYLQQVKMISMDWREASGPIYARALAQTLRSKQDQFCLQIDSHSDTVEGWDRVVVNEWTIAQNEYAVLSTYLNPILGLDAMYSRTDLSVLCRLDVANAQLYDGKKLFRNALSGTAWDLKKPKLSTLWAAGFSFAKCHFEDKVPIDESLRYVWDGEEFTRMARLWTSGYDVYAPSKNILFHDYNTTTAFKWDWLSHLNEKQHKQRLDSISRLYAIQNNLETPPVEKPFGLGNCRSYEQFIKFVGIDLEKMEGPKDLSKCLDNVYVPYDFACHNNEDNDEPKTKAQQQIEQQKQQIEQQPQQVQSQKQLRSKMTMDDQVMLLDQLSDQVESLLENQKTFQRQYEDLRRTVMQNIMLNNEVLEEKYHDSHPKNKNGAVGADATTELVKTFLTLFFMILFCLASVMGLIALTKFASNSTISFKTAKMT